MTLTFTENDSTRWHAKILGFMNATYDTGYYAALLQRAQLTEAERDEYRKLHTEALSRRTEARLALEL